MVFKSCSTSDRLVSVSSQMDLAAFDAAHIQNVIDEGEQMVAGGQDLLQDSPEPAPLSSILLTASVVEPMMAFIRRADIMGHIGEERTLGPVGGLRGARQPPKEPD